MSFTRSITCLAVFILLLVACGGGDTSDAGSPAAAPAGGEAGDAIEPAEYDPPLARQLAVQAVGIQDPTAALAPLRQALAHNDGLADAWLLLATAHARLGRETAAVDALTKLSELGIRPPIEAFQPLAGLQTDPRLPEFGRRLRESLEPLGESEVLFTLPQRDLVSEGIAHDPASGAYFVSSVHRRKVVRRDADGSLHDLVSHEAGDDVDAVFGLAWDEGRGRLWAATSTIRNMRDFDPDDDLQSALLAIDPRSGEIVERHEPGPGHRFNDLVVAADGTVYVSDNHPPGALFRLPAGGELERIGADMTLHSPQGLALVDAADGGGQILLVADYSYGIVALDLGDDGGHWFVQPPSMTWMQTLDGLTRIAPDALVVVQNGGYPPHRILRLELSADRRSLELVEVLAQALPQWDEPTLGTLVRGADGAPDRFVYVARSQWGRFTPEGEILPLDELQEPLIMSLDLPGAGPASTASETTGAADP